MGILFHVHFTLKKITSKYWTLVNELMICILKYLRRNLVKYEIYFKCFKKIRWITDGQRDGQTERYVIQQVS